MGSEIVDDPIGSGLLQETGQPGFHAVEGFFEVFHFGGVQEVRGGLCIFRQLGEFWERIFTNEMEEAKCGGSFGRRSMFLGVEMNEIW